MEQIIQLALVVVVGMVLKLQTVARVHHHPGLV
jgi:hypothetical protein